MPEIIGAAIAAIGAFLGVLLASFWTAKSNKNIIAANNENLATTIKAQNDQLEKSLKSEIGQSNRELSLQYITNKRVDWIYTVRQGLSDFIAHSFFIAEKYKVGSNAPDKVPADELLEINKLLAQLRLLFNFSGNRDKKILDLLDNIQANISLPKDEFRSCSFQQDVIHLTQQSQIYLKLEWERVKLETTENLTGIELNRKLEHIGTELDQKMMQNTEKQ